MSSEPIQTEYKRNEDGTFAQGGPGGPGRPAGSSMKEYWKRKFYEMTDYEKEQWCKENRVSPDLIWRMSEGQPKQDLGIEGELVSKVVAVDE